MSSAAILIHHADATRRRALRFAILASMTDAPIVLLSSSIAEAAKWLRDERLALVIARAGSPDDAPLRAAVASLRREVPLLWLHDAVEQDQEVRHVARRVIALLPTTGR